MKTQLVLLVAFAACGSSGGSGGEACDGVDDNENGVIDEGCPCSPFDISMPGSVLEAGLVWAGDGFFSIASENNPDVRIAKITADGSVSTTLNAGPATANGAVAWTGSVLGVVIMSPASVSSFPSVALSRFDARGTFVGTSSVAAKGNGARIAWAGDRFVITWIPLEGVAAIALAEFADDGSQIGTTTELLLGESGLRNDSIAVTEAAYVLGLDHAGTAWVYWVDRATKEGGFPQLTLPGGASHISVASRDGSFAAVRADVFQTFDGTGEVVSPAVTLPVPALATMIAATAQGYRAFPYLLNGTVSEITTIDLDPHGSVVSVGSPFVSFSGSSTPFAVASSDGRFGIALPHGPTFPTDTVQVVQQCAN